MGSVGIYIVAILLAIVFSKLIFKSLKIVWAVIINALLGGIIIWLLNLFGIGIVMNWVTAFLIGFLGVPGVVVVLVLQFLF